MAVSIQALKASDGTGNASVATVTTARSAGATTILVDTVQDIPTNFFGTMGTPHTFSDPVTGEEITIISEATAVDFKGHVDGSNLEIDTIANGYTDAGSEVGDIVIIKPTTQWANALADALAVVLDDDGKLKIEAPITGGNTLANGWIDANEAWTYSDWSATTRILELTVPTDATTKYNNGNRVKLAQTTPGTYYGIIHKVEATTLHIFIEDGITPVDTATEEFTVNSYSSQKTPLGFDVDPSKWTLSLISSTERTTTSTSLTSLTDSLTHGVGAWLVSLTASARTVLSANVYRYGYVGITSDGGSSITDYELLAAVGGTSSLSGDRGINMTYVQKHVIKSAETTWTLAGYCVSSSVGLGVGFDSNARTTIRAVSAYL